SVRRTAARPAASICGRRGLRPSACTARNGGRWSKRSTASRRRSPGSTRRSSSTISRAAPLPRRHSSRRSNAMQNENTAGPAVLAAAGAAAVAVSASSGRAKGPIVWLDMDQQALDDAYDQIVYAPNRDQIAKRRIANSDKARAVIGAPERVAYGPSEIEKLDIYRTKQ